MGGYGARGVRDPRNLKDIGFKRQQAEKLISYLMEHNYDRTLSFDKLVNVPTSQEFVHIVSFLLRQAIPDFDFSGSYQEELPVVLKLLGYPFPIAKGVLAATIAPLHWPPLLAALGWLVDLLRYSKAETARAEGAESFDAEEDGHKMFFDYLSRCYAFFLAGQDVRSRPAVLLCQASSATFHPVLSSPYSRPPVSFAASGLAGPC